MKLGFRHINRKVFSLLAIAFLMSILFNKVLFTHAHIAGDGNIIVHAHPFADPNSHDDTESHSHSDFSVDSSLDDLTYLSLRITTLPQNLPLLVCVSEIATSQDAIQNFNLSKRYRGPPAV